MVGTWTQPLLHVYLASVCGPQMQSELGLGGGHMDAATVDLMEHIWQEATGELDDVLAADISTIKAEQV